MRKIKKINGFLVVKFNDREKREYEGTALGEYGVIDAEVYTGNLDIDRGAMEYDDADTLEVAVELARGLESEEDITDEPPTYTAAVETNESYTEEAVELAALIEGWTRRLATQVKSKHYEGITPYQAENIFRTNIQTAYNVGHYKRMTEPGVKALRPYWQYDAVNDSKTRPSHLAMDGRVFMADDPIWDTWFPPNGFKCRCTVKTLSKRQMEQRGLTVETEAPRAARLEDGRFVNILPDPQFDTNPAKVRYQPDLTGYPEPLKKAYQEREKGNTPP